MGKPSKSLPIAEGSVVVLAIDAPVVTVRRGRSKTSFERRFFLCRGADLLGGGAGGFRRVSPKDALGEATRGVFSGLEREGSEERIFFVIYPTRTYSEGFGGNIFSDLAPEDRAMIRRLSRRYPGHVESLKVWLQDTDFFEDLPGYFLHEREKLKYREERTAYTIIEEKAGEGDRRGAVGFNAKFLTNMGRIFRSCMTRPNRQDYMYLVTKTFGLNLLIRLAFVTKGVRSEGLTVFRAVCSTSWYQLQDAVFTVFGQTYMKFLGKMTGLLRVRNAYVGDFVFVYIQLCSFEFLNRLVLGPLGDNPIVYTPVGIALIFCNVLQGMVSGGPITPAINKMRKVGLISHSTMMHFYQLASLTMHFGLFATFGYQFFYAVLTGGVLLFSWSGYIAFSTLFKDPEFSRVEDPAALSRLDRLAAACYSSASA